jgi:hypothetical protein
MRVRTHIFFIKIKDAHDISPDNPALFYIWYPAGYRYQILLIGYRILKIAGYPANWKI